MRLALLVFVLLAMMGVSLGIWRASESLPQPTATIDSTPAIGGSFTLTSQNNNPISDSAFRGKLMLVFFGFTNCPDICPLGLGHITEAMKQLSIDEANQVVPVFITVDPARDSPEALKAYSANFDPRIVMLTGTQAQIDSVVQAYKVYVSAPEPVKEAEAHDHGDGAHSDHSHAGKLGHSGYMYIMGRDGAYLTHLDANAKPDEIARTLRAYMKKPAA